MVGCLQAELFVPIILHPHLFYAFRKVKYKSILHSCHVPGDETHRITVGLGSPCEFLAGESFERIVEPSPVVLKSSYNQLPNVHKLLPVS
jgi:hypothetical protein